MRLKFLDVLLHLRYRGPNVIPCDVPVRRGEEMGWFEHGSTIIVFAPRGASLSEEVREGGRIQMGRPLMRIDRIDANSAL
jgi:phosphatidylserine decarboxylase